MIDGQNFFDQPVKGNLRTYNNIQKLRMVNRMIVRLVAYRIELF